MYDRIHLAPKAIVDELRARQFHFADSKPDSATSLFEAATFLASVPSLEEAVAAAVSEIVLLVAEPGYDVSHSEPRWPQTIFVTAVAGEGQVGALRTLENIIHEAMHLQLTTYEGHVPLVADSVAHMISPWRTEPRRLQGVLHGAYVFRCIAAFFAQPALAIRLDDAGNGYIVRRLAEIAEELSRIDFDRLHRGLTAEGGAFCDILLREPRATF